MRVHILTNNISFSSFQLSAAGNSTNTKLQMKCNFKTKKTKLNSVENQNRPLILKKIAPFIDKPSSVNEKLKRGTFPPKKFSLRCVQFLQSAHFLTLYVFSIPSSSSLSLSSFSLSLSLFFCVCFYDK